MLAAIRLCESHKSQNIAAQDIGVDRSRISRAKVVLEYAPKLVDLVISDESARGKRALEAKVRL